MHEVTDSKTRGAFTGYAGGMLFQLANGQVWQQKRYKYEYRYAYRPAVRIYHEGGAYFIDVECMDEPIEVVRVSVLEEGLIVSKFTGFSNDARFEFQSGRVWVPAEYKYHYHYAHRPHAIVVDGINGPELKVEGANETLQVRRA